MKDFISLSSRKLWLFSAVMLLTSFILNPAPGYLVCAMACLFFGLNQASRK